MAKMVLKEDVEKLRDYHDGPAQDHFGMSYADGIRDVLEWLEGGRAPWEDE